MKVKSLILILLAIILILITNVNVILLLIIILILTSNVNVNVKASGVWSPDGSHLSCRLTYLHSLHLWICCKKMSLLASGTFKAFTPASFTYCPCNNQVYE